MMSRPRKHYTRAHPAPNKETFGGAVICLCRTCYCSDQRTCTKKNHACCGYRDGG